MSWSSHWWLPKPAFMRRTGSLCGSLGLFLPLTFALSLFLSLPLSLLLFPCFLLSLTLGLLQCLFSLFGQFRHRQRSEVEVCPGTGIVTSVQVLIEPCRLAGMAGCIDHSGLWGGTSLRGRGTLWLLCFVQGFLFDVNWRNGRCGGRTRDGGR